MAQFPPFKRFSIEAYNQAPEYFQRFLGQMNTWMDPVYNSLINNLTLSQNIASRVVTVTITAGVAATDNTASIADPKEPLALFVGKVTNTDGTYAAPAGAVFASYSYVAGQINITSITGLTSGDTYNVNLVIFY